MIKCKFDGNFPAKLVKYFNDPHKLQKSIALKPKKSIIDGPFNMLDRGYHVSHIYEGWGESFGSSSWAVRWRAWFDKAVAIEQGKIAGAPIYFLTNNEVFKASELAIHINKNSVETLEYLTDHAIPIFTSLLDKDHDTIKLLETTNLCQEILLTSASTGKGASTERFISNAENKSNQSKEETNKMKQLFDKVVSQNKEAVALAGKLSVGKAGNAFLLSQVTGKFPWYARLFGAKAKVQDNPFAKLASAQVANALAVHFAPNNKKIAYVADAMLQEAMVDLITNSNQLQSLIEQLEGFAGSITDAVE